MIVGIGVDLVEIARMEALLERRGARACARLFTEHEVRRCREARQAAESFAARFAAKEALFKALGTGVGRGGEWTEVEVRSGEGGAPSLHLSGRAARLAGERGVRAVHLSLTHAGGTAAAFVVLEG